MESIKWKHVLLYSSPIFGEIKLNVDFDSREPRGEQRTEKAINCIGGKHKTLDPKCQLNSFFSILETTVFFSKEGSTEIDCNINN